jgi:hypothetical protein
MDQKGEPKRQSSTQTDSEGADGREVVAPSREALREWAKCIEQDSQAETFEYLGESVAEQSGE